jgi:hypothetical protein
MLFGGRGSLTILTGNGMGCGGSGSARVDRTVTKPDFMAGDILGVVASLFPYLGDMHWEQTGR